MMLVATRVAIHLALRTTVADLIPFIACLRSRRDRGANLVDTIASLVAVTLSRDYAAWFYLPLCVVLATCQYFADTD
jgi:hypothetical protein